MNSQSTVKFSARCVGALLIAGTFFSGAAFATEPAVFSQVVKFGDLNLNNPAGIAALYLRIHRAAEQTCGLTGGERDLAMLAFEKKCAAASEARAVGEVRNAALLAYYNAKIGRPSGLLAFNNSK